MHTQQRYNKHVNSVASLCIQCVELLHFWDSNFGHVLALRAARASS